MIEFLELVKENIKKLRDVKKNIGFIQIGPYDGVSFNDVANLTLKKDDYGIFIEPNKLIFEKLKLNKIDFVKSKFVDCAVIPNENFEHEVFYIDKYGGQSTFVKNVFNDRIHVESKVDVLTVKDFINTHVDFDVDVLFTDCEGYDHDIIINFLNYQKPSIIYFESWNTQNLNNQCIEKKFTTRDEIISFLELNNYSIAFEPIEENIIAYNL